MNTTVFFQNVAHKGLTGIAPSNEAPSGDDPAEATVNK